MAPFTQAMFPSSRHLSILPYIMSDVAQILGIEVWSSQCVNSDEHHADVGNSNWPPRLSDWENFCDHWSAGINVET